MSFEWMIHLQYLWLYYSSPEGVTGLVVVASDSRERAVE